MRLVAFAGTLREKSTNKGILRAARDLGSKLGVTVEIASINDIPLYNGDIDPTSSSTAEFPAAVAELRKKVVDADGVLFATGEYNYSLPAPGKNAIDWLSRAVGDEKPLYHKPVALVGAAGSVGSLRSQYHARQVLTFPRCYVLPEEFFCNAFEPGVFDADGNLVGESALQRLDQFLAEFKSFTTKLTK